MARRLVIDLNADVGEGLDSGAERKLMRLVSSANIACGGHAGDAGSMERAFEAALEFGLAVGAHPSYEDRDRFGRVDLPLSPQAIHELVVRQLDEFVTAAVMAGAEVAHVKAHGALYHRLAADANAASSFVAAVASVMPSAAIVGLPGSRIAEATVGFGGRFVAEGFADRAYTADGRLVPRGSAGAVLSADGAAAQVLALLGQAEPQPGLPVGAVETICLHGDHDGAAEIAAEVVAACAGAGIRIGSIDPTRPQAEVPE